MQSVKMEAKTKKNKNIGSNKGSGGVSWPLNAHCLLSCQTE